MLWAFKMVPGIWKLPHPPTVLGVSDEHMWGDYSNFGFLHISAECNFSFNSLFSLYNFILSSYHSPPPVHLPPPPPLPVIVYLSGLSDYRQMKIHPLAMIDLWLKEFKSCHSCVCVWLGDELMVM